VAAFKCKSYGSARAMPAQAAVMRAVFPVSEPRNIIQAPSEHLVAVESPKRPAD